jgi:hypothetical protein
MRWKLVVKVIAGASVGLLLGERVTGTLTLNFGAVGLGCVVLGALVAEGVVALREKPIPE